MKGTYILCNEQNFLVYLNAQMQYNSKIFIIGKKMIPNVLDYAMLKGVMGTEIDKKLN